MSLVVVAGGAVVVEVEGVGGELGVVGAVGHHGGGVGSGVLDLARGVGDVVEQGAVEALAQLEGEPVVLRLGGALELDDAVEVGERPCRREAVDGHRAAALHGNGGGHRREEVDVGGTLQLAAAHVEVARAPARLGDSW